MNTFSAAALSKMKKELPDVLMGQVKKSDESVAKASKGGPSGSGGGRASERQLEQYVHGLDMLCSSTHSTRGAQVPHHGGARSPRTSALALRADPTRAPCAPRANSRAEPSRRAKWSGGGCCKGMLSAQDSGKVAACAGWRFWSGGRRRTRSVIDR